MVLPFEPRGRLVIGRCRLAGCSPAPVAFRPTVTAVPAAVGIANALLPPKSGSLASKATRGVVTACHQAATERHSRSTSGANPRRKYSALWSVCRAERRAVDRRASAHGGELTTNVRMRRYVVPDVSSQISLIAARALTGVPVGRWNFRI